MLIYGPNNSCKSNLGTAIMDITIHLTDNFKFDNIIYAYYVNGDFIDNLVEFKYEFLLNNIEIKYLYKKDSQARLLSEELIENGKVIFKYNYETNKFDNNIEEAQTIDISKRTNKDMSVLKYIYNNTLYWPENSTLK